jgi:hypothetical protein
MRQVLYVVSGIVLWAGTALLVIWLVAPLVDNQRPENRNPSPPICRALEVRQQALNPFARGYVARAEDYRQLGVVADCIDGQGNWR